MSGREAPHLCVLLNEHLNATLDRIPLTDQTSFVVFSKNRAFHVRLKVSHGHRAEDSFGVPACAGHGRQAAGSRRFKIAAFKRAGKQLYQSGAGPPHSKDASRRLRHPELAFLSTQAAQVKRHFTKKLSGSVKGIRVSVAVKKAIKCVGA